MFEGGSGSTQEILFKLKDIIKFKNLKQNSY